MNRQTQLPLALSWLRGHGRSEKRAEVILLRSVSKQAFCKLGFTEELLVASIEVKKKQL